MNLDNLHAIRSTYEAEIAAKPKSSSNDKTYLAWLMTVTTPEIVIKELLDNWHMFEGDNYYADFQGAFHDKLKELV